MLGNQIGHQTVDSIGLLSLQQKQIQVVNVPRSRKICPPLLKGPSWEQRQMDIAGKEEGALAKPAPVML